MKHVLAPALGVLLVLCGGCRKRESGPEDAFNTMQAALVAKDGAKVWNLMAVESRHYFDKMAESARGSASSAKYAKPWMNFLSCTQAELNGITGAKVVEFHMRTLDRNDPEQHNHFRVVRDARAVYDIVNKLTKADGKMSKGDGPGFEPISFEFEDRMWKVNFDQVPSNPGYLKYFHGPKQEVE